MRHVEGLTDALTLSGVELGTSGWMNVPQERIDQFAESTGDHQWIHVDRARAEQGPFGTTIAHGYLTLALVVPLLWELVSFPEDAMVVNYGLNKVRFPAPVPSGSRVRLRATVLGVTAVSGGAEIVLGFAVESDRSDRPACVAEAVYRYLG